MTIAAKQTPIKIKEIWHRDAHWWMLSCAEKEPFNTTVKKIEGRRWSATHSAWLLPYEKTDNAKLNIIFGLGEALVTALTSTDKATTEREKTKSATPTEDPITTKTTISIKNKEAMELYKRQIVLKGYSPATLKTYTSELRQFLETLKGVPATDLSTERLKDYFYYCHTQLKMSEAHIHSRINAIKFYYEQVLGRESFFWDIPRPKKQMQNPTLFNQDEIAAILKATENVKHKTMLMMAYSAGLRVSEVVALKPENIDSKRMCLHIVQGKGKKDRMVGLSPVLLVMLRAYWKEYKPKVYLFEGQVESSPYTTRSLQLVMNQAKEKANVMKKGNIHALRHSFATHLLDKGTDVTMIMKLLGHNDIRTTLRYLHVSNRDLLHIVSPLDNLQL